MDTHYPNKHPSLHNYNNCPSNNSYLASPKLSLTAPATRLTASRMSSSDAAAYVARKNRPGSGLSFSAWNHEPRAMRTRSEMHALNSASSSWRRDS